MSSVKDAANKAAGIGNMVAGAGALGGLGYGAYTGARNLAYDEEAAIQRSKRNRAFGAGLAAGALGPAVLTGAAPGAGLSALLNVDKLTGSSAPAAGVAKLSSAQHNILCIKAMIGLQKLGNRIYGS